MTCREAIDFLASYLDGELPPDVRSTFDAHLAVCPSCVAYLESYQATIRLEKSAADATGSRVDLPEDLVQAILSARDSA